MQTGSVRGAPGPPSHPTVWESLTTPFKLLLVGGIGVVVYGLLTWAIGAYWGISTDGNSVRIGSVPVPYLGAVATGTAILALGTAALAYAAFQQSVATREQLEAVESNRIKALCPHLDLQLLDGATGAEYPGSFSLGPDRSAIWLRVRNLGPGNAVNVLVAVYVWTLKTDGPNAKLSEYEHGGPMRRALTDPPGMSPRAVIGHLIALPVNGSYTVPVQIRVPPLADYRDSRPEPSTSYPEQLLFVVKGEDVEGHLVEPVRLALRLQMIASSSEEPWKSLRSFTTLWRFLSPKDAAIIPLRDVGSPFDE